MENDSLKQINKIKSTISKNDQIVWTCQASTKCYTDEISKLEDEEKILTKDIHTINKQIKESKSLIGILEKCCEVQNKTLEISLESLVTERLYKKCFEENVNKHKRECNLLIGEFSEHLDQCKTKLEHTNPLFKILQEKKVELKKSKILCLVLQQRLKSNKKNDEQRLQIRKQLFYTGIVSLAETWLNEKKYLEAQKELQELKQQERELMIKLMEWTERLRVKEKMGDAPRHAFITLPQIQFSKKSTNDDVSLNNEKVTTPAPPNAGNCEKPSMNPFKDIEALFGESKSGPSASIEKSSTYNAFPNKHDNLPKDVAKICPKVRILENKTLKMSYVPQPVKALRKEEISKAIDVKLQRVSQNFKRSMSRQNSRKMLIDDTINKANKSNINTQKSSQEANKEPLDETGKNQTEATQDLENLNNPSQETRMAINILSQDSVTSSSAETKLKKFKYSPSDDTNKKLDELSYAEKEIHPQRNDVDNGHLNTKSEETKSQKNEIVNNNLFEMNDGNAFGRNGQFSMNFGTKEMFKPLGNTLNFSQSFKINDRGNNTTDVVFKVPEAAPVNNFLSQSQNSMVASGTSSQAPTQLKNSQNSSLHERNNFFDMHGTPYDFGSTMTQISEIPNDSYELAWSPPAPDLSDNSPMDINPLFPFGQSNINFGFSFFK